MDCARGVFQGHGGPSGETWAIHGAEAGGLKAARAERQRVAEACGTGWQMTGREMQAKAAQTLTLWRSLQVIIDFAFPSESFTGTTKLPRAE